MDDGVGAGARGSAWSGVSAAARPTGSGSAGTDGAAGGASAIARGAAGAASVSVTSVGAAAAGATGVSLARLAWPCATGWLFWLRSPGERCGPLRPRRALPRLSRFLCALPTLVILSVLTADTLVAMSTSAPTCARLVPAPVYPGDRPTYHIPAQRTKESFSRPPRRSAPMRVNVSLYLSDESSVCEVPSFAHHFFL